MNGTEIIKALGNLTGRTRFRSSWLGRLVLQVEYAQAYQPVTWRDATTQDLAELHQLHYSVINVLLPDVPRGLPGEDKGNGSFTPQKTH